MNCIARCSESETPVICLADFLENLALLGWNGDEITAVRNAVMPLMGELRPGDSVTTGYVSLADK